MRYLLKQKGALRDSCFTINSCGFSRKLDRVRTSYFNFNNLFQKSLMHKCIAVLGVEFQSVYSIHRATVLAVSFEVLHTKESYSLHC